MGEPKQVLPFGDTTMIGAVVDAASRSRLQDLVVVTGFHHRRVEAAVGDRVRIARNPDPGRGNMSSLLVGLDAAGDVDGVVVLLSDMPQVSTGVIDGLIDGISSTGAAAGWVAYADGRGHPVALARAILPDVRRLEGPKALWSFLEGLDPEDVFVLRVGTDKPTDVNTREDYEEALTKRESRTPPRG